MSTNLITKSLLAVVAAAACSGVSADTIPVKAFRHAGPFAVTAPVMIDSLDVNSRPFAPGALLDMPGTPDAAFAGLPLTASGILPASSAPAEHLLQFTLKNTGYAEPTLCVDGLEDYRLSVDGASAEAGRIVLKPGTHKCVIRSLTAAGKPDTAAVSIIVPAGQSVEVGDAPGLFTLDNVLHGRRIQGVEISPDGKYLITLYADGLPGGRTDYVRTLSTTDGKRLFDTRENITWDPAGGSRYLRLADKGNGKADVTATDAATDATETIAKGVPAKGLGHIDTRRGRIFYTLVSEGPRENEDVYEILEPEDRQPGWRNRYNLAVYDIASGMMMPLTFGHHSAFLNDVSADGSKALVTTARTRLAKRPTTVTTMMVIDLATGRADTLVADDGFIGSGRFMADGTTVVLTGSPEALGGIGRNLPADRIPSSVDMQLFAFDTDSRAVTPLTKNFDPSVSDFAVSQADNRVYFTAENRDKVSLYSLDPKSGKITELPIGEDLVKSFSVADGARALAFAAQSMSNPDRLYVLDTKSLKSAMLDEPMAEDLADIKLGQTEGWSFVNSRGDSIHGRFYLPPSFDPARKYPLIVNYYGGCSPTSRNFESRYPHHAYAAQDYVVYVIEPSGATGFGQEFSSRHVNTAGKGVAEDIIEGTREFCRTHAYVDTARIGCIGASYGGFMTQYLQTLTPMFAAAISHAGISDHTSYWGEGYWGYSYSEVSMADSYPWTRKDLYVDQSPLYNADKITTPLLFLHGDADNNVPVGESIQMFTALKLLGRPTAFVAVKDQDHHILDYDKRIRWQDTIFAWFAKYLKDQPAWWDALYPSKSL